MLNRVRQTLEQLPRDTRDTLFLLAVIAWVAMLQTPHVPLWCSALIVGMLGWRTVLAIKGLPLPGWGWRVGLLALTLGATWLTFRTIMGQEAGVTLIVVLLAMKTLELRARRDAFVVFFLGFFTLLTHFFFSQSLLTAAGILVALLGLLTALVNAHMPVGRPSLRQAARTAGGMALLGAPIMLVLFVLFPRMAPLWGMPGDQLAGRSGLSDTMRVGQIASLAMDDSIALRVRFEGAAPAQHELYFRGPVLTQFNGEQWRPLDSGFPASMGLPLNLQVAGTPVRYEVTMEPHKRPWLFLLEAATTAPALPSAQAFQTTELQWRTSRPMTELVRYRAESYLQFQYGPRQSRLALQDQIELPPGYNPRTLMLAQELRREVGAGPAYNAALVQRVLDRLRTGGYRYTLEPGVFGRHTADEFWFDRREGFCEHIASSFVVLMRALDIPARIVTGYQGGELNPVDGFWVVRQRDAHAWAEVWLPGQGWTRVDPTSAVAPSRTASLERLSAPAGLLNTALGTLNPAWVSQVRAVWDAVNNGWDQWVLNYTQGRQLDLLKNIGFTNPAWTDLAYVLIAVVVLASLVGAGWTLWERQQQDPWLRLLGRARQRLHQRGLHQALHLPPRALATQAGQHFGNTAFSQHLHQWLLAMEQQRYSRQSTRTLADLQRDFDQLRWPQQGQH